MSSGLLDIGSSALMAYKRTLNTIGHNIANVNTVGYSRQSTDLAARAPQANGFGFAGTGVDVTSIRRSFDAFVENNVRSSTTSAAEYDSFHQLAVQLDNVLADPNAGMSGAMQRFFNSVQDVSNAPADPAARQVMLAQADQLAGHFNELANYIESTRGQVNNTIKGGVTEINRITQNIAQLNQSIALETGRSGGQPPNDLLDQRDTLIQDLSKYLKVTTYKQDDGSINVAVAKGQLLVRGVHASSLKTTIINGDPNQLGISLSGGNNPDVPLNVSSLGGKLGGAFGFRDRMLDGASNSLGRVALGIATMVNQQNRRGMDLSGKLGNDMFTTGVPQLRVGQGNASNISVAYSDVTQLTNLDYTLKYKGGSWTLQRNDTGQAVAMTGTGTSADPFIVDGLKITINTSPANGDNYVIQPTRNGARNIKMILPDSRMIAAAAPVRSLAGSSNTGTGAISAGVITNINNAAFQTTAGSLTPPLLIRFTATNKYDILDNTNPASPVALETGITYNPATGGDIFPTPGGLDYGYQMKLDGAPVAGDTFTTQYNTNGSGDNRNALLIAGFSTEKTLNGATASFADSYNGLVADVGTGTRQAELQSVSQNSLLKQAQATREQISGVNLDDEAAKLVQFQQAYQASAKVIATASALFDTLLRAVR